jgi:predicted extracellular nuclease
VSESSSTPIGESLQVLSGVWTGPAAESPGLLNTEPPPPPSATEEMIHDVQGPGLSSPLEGQQVIVEGVVPSDQQDGDFNGWFMQEEDFDHDADPATSEGVFIFEGGNTVEVNVGDIVRVEGTVVEFFGGTQITDVVDVTVTGSSSVTVTPVSLPWADADQPEWYEGMWVTVPQPLTISEYFNFDRFGEIVLTVGRPPTPTAVFDPGSTEQADLALANQLGRITLDDNRTSENPDPAIHPNGAVFDLNNLFRGGDIVENTTGVINYSFGRYRIQPTQGADYTSTNPRQLSPDPVGGSLNVASFNVLNYFTTIDGNGSICGPNEDQGCRGADSPEEFERQRAKIVAAIADIGADIVGLLEIENFKAGGVDEPIANLVSGINDILGPGTYAYVETGPIGDDAIKVAMIYKPATVSLNGAYAVLDGSVDPRFNDDKNRPALAQTFTQLSNGESVTVAVNHLKSKGSNCDSLGDPDLGDGAGNCNLTRTSAAEALVDWLAADSTGSGEDDVLIIGDLNSYDKEDPIDAIIAGGYTDLVADAMGEFAYTYVFSGQWGYLDYALANGALQSAVTGTTVWHINADESDILDYNLGFKQPPQQALYEPNAFRASDHDPVIVGLELDRTPPEVSAAMLRLFGKTYEVDFVCTDTGDPSPTCEGDVNGFPVDDGQLVVINRGRPASGGEMIGDILYIRARFIYLTVTGTDVAGNSTTVIVEPERPRDRNRVR